METLREKTLASTMIQSRNLPTHVLFFRFLGLLLVTRHSWAITGSQNSGGPTAIATILIPSNQTQSLYIQ